MLEINEWQHSCKESDLPAEMLEEDGQDERAVDRLDPIIGDPSERLIDWAIGTGVKRLGGGYFSYCPYCGAKLPATHDEAMAMYQAEALCPTSISTKTAANEPGD